MAHSPDKRWADRAAVSTVSSAAASPAELVPGASLGQLGASSKALGGKRLPSRTASETEQVVTSTPRRLLTSVWLLPCVLVVAALAAAGYTAFATNESAHDAVAADFRQAMGKQLDALAQNTLKIKGNLAAMVHFMRTHPVDRGIVPDTYYTHMDYMLTGEAEETRAPGIDIVCVFPVVKNQYRAQVEQTLGDRHNNGNPIEFRATRWVSLTSIAFSPVSPPSEQYLPLVAFRPEGKVGSLLVGLEAPTWGPNRTSTYVSTSIADTDSFPLTFFAQPVFNLPSNVNLSTIRDPAWRNSGSQSVYAVHKVPPGVDPTKEEPEYGVYAHESNLAGIVACIAEVDKLLEASLDDKSLLIVVEEFDLLSYKPSASRLDFLRQNEFKIRNVPLDCDAACQSTFFGSVDTSSSDTADLVSDVAGLALDDFKCGDGLQVIWRQHEAGVRASCDTLQELAQTGSATISSSLVALSSTGWAVHAVRRTEGVDNDYSMAVVVLVAGLFLAFLVWQALQMLHLNNRQVREHGRYLAADAARRAHESTMSYACHELRNPLHAITATCNFVLSDAMRRKKQLLSLPLAPPERSGAAAAPADSGLRELLGLNERMDEDLQTIATAAFNMKTLVDDILDLSKLRAGQVKIDKGAVDVRALVESLALQNRSFAQVPITTHVADTVPRLIHADGLRVRQVLNNGITNAAKLTMAGSISIRCRLVDAVTPDLESSTSAGDLLRSSTSIKVKPTQLCLRVEVVETGPGLGGNSAEELFRPYSQADGAAKAAGTGLGLPICRMLIRAMHGEIGLHDRTDGVTGGVFWFELPCRPSGPDAMAERRSATSGSTDGLHLDPLMEDPGAAPGVAAIRRPAGSPLGSPGMPQVDRRISLQGVRALVVDDEKVNRRIATRMLTTLGCEVETLEDGDQVLDYLVARGVGYAPGSGTVTVDVAESTAKVADEADGAGAHTEVQELTPGGLPMDESLKPAPHIIMLDIIMKRSNGAEVCKELRARGVTLPILAITGNAAKHDIEAYKSGGFNEVVTKPFSAEQLQLALQRYTAIESKSAWATAVDSS